MGNVRKKNKPAKVKKTDLEEVEVLLTIGLWGKGDSVSEIHQNEHLPPELIEKVFKDCEAVQDLCDKLMATDSPPATEKDLKDAVAVTGIYKSNEIVDEIIKYSDINNNGNWDMYKTFNWGA